MNATLGAVALVTLLAMARITRFITDDKIMKPVRDHIARRSEPQVIDGELKLAAPWWRVAASWQNCAWCVSIWVCFAYSVPAWTWVAGQPPTQWTLTTWFLYATSALAASHTIATAAQWLDAPPPPREHIINAPVQIHCTNLKPTP